MIIDKIADIISMVIKSTESGDLIWTSTKPDSNYKSERQLSSLSEDGLSAFEINIKYVLSGNYWSLDTSCGFWIKNKDLPGGSMYLGSYSNPKLLELRDLLNKKYCSDLIPTTKEVENKLSDICKGISKSNHRDSLISRIFNSKK